jgi:hypothetical protein
VTAKNFVAAGRMKLNFRKASMKVTAVIYIRTILMLIIWKELMDVPGFQYARQLDVQMAL